MTRDTIILAPVLPSVRRHGFPEGINEPFWLFDNDTVLKVHPKYNSASNQGLSYRGRSNGAYESEA